MADLARGGLVMLVVGLTIAGFGGYDYVQQSSAVEDAVSVDVTITDTHVESVSGRRGSTNYRPVVSFDYRYRGESYTANNLYPATFDPEYDSRSKARSALAGYEPGDEVTAHVDPDSPGGAFLEREVSNGPLRFMAIGGVGALLGAVSAIRGS
jgi:hypothetical protein